MAWKTEVRVQMRMLDPWKERNLWRAGLPIAIGTFLGNLGWHVTVGSGLVHGLAVGTLSGIFVMLVVYLIRKKRRAPSQKTD